MADEKASETLKVAPVSGIDSNKEAAQTQNDTADLHELAQKTIKLAPPTRTGFQRPVPMPAATPEPARPQAGTAPAEPAKPLVMNNIPMQGPATGAGEEPPKAHVRTIARQTIKIAPPPRLGAQRPAPTASASPEMMKAPPKPPTLDAVARPASKPTLNLDFAALKEDAKRTQNVNAPFAAKAPMTEGSGLPEKAVAQQETVPPPLSPKPPVMQLKKPVVAPEASGAVPSPKAPTVQLKPAAAPEVSEAVPSPKAPTVQLKPAAPAAPEAAPSPKVPAIQLKKTASPEVSEATPSPKAPTVQMRPAAAPESSSGSSPALKTPENQTKEKSEKPADVKNDVPSETASLTDAEEDNGTGEPGVFFTILAAVSLVLLLLSTYVLLAQYSGTWLANFPNLPLPGLK